MTRARYLFHLADLCNSPPPVVDAIGVGDFARLVAGVDMHIEAMAKASQR